MDSNFFGPPPKSPFYQGICRPTETPYPNPFFSVPAVNWNPQPPFWFSGDPHSPLFGYPVGDPDDYRFGTLSQPLSEKTLLEEMEIERPERYLPGEIYRNETPKRPVEDLSKTANCPKIWTPKDPLFHTEFKPSREMMNPPLLLDGVLRRKAETLESFRIPEKPVIEQSCEGVEDAETKAIKKPNYSDILRHADTRTADFKCEPEDKVEFYDACKIPNTQCKAPPSVIQNE
ncbi:uncharacterized protein LOC128988124 [Macrosteles quadrilineatus]|uniref:uncharacterized protein LOC128988124 n=1 Tax=Macrosteles quadrilineatus TaxID=74068 RepID=UPI0023E0F2E9|nr:uncharacterized protein LOC128988124 [Macrosteles quadrilineatus]